MTYLVFTSPVLAHMPISQENLNVFCSDSITMVSVWNHFIFMPIDNPRWPPGAITKNSTNMKMTISEEPFNEVDGNLFQNMYIVSV